MILACEQLITTLSQEFVVDLRNGLYSPIIAPCLYVHNAPSGTFYLDLKQNGDLLKRKTFDIQDMKDQLGTTDNNMHLYFRIHFDDAILKSASYELVLGSDDYVFSSTSFLGWCKDWDNDFEGNAPVDWSNRSLCFRIFNKENREL